MRPYIYVIGSLRNPVVSDVAAAIRQAGFEVFDDWMAAGPEADDYWKRYEEARGHSYREALNGHAAHHVFHYDKRHLDAASFVVLVAPAGKSAHLELGYAIGKGKGSCILVTPENTRWDVMYKFAGSVEEDVAGVLARIMEAHS